MPKFSRNDKNVAAKENMMNGRTSKQVRTYVSAGALMVAAVLIGHGRAIGQVPVALQPPAGNTESVRAYGQGVQIYVATPRAGDPTRFQWTFVAPEATLYNHGGHVIGMHYAGPTWEANNGSKVVGKRLAAASPDPNSIPWLLLAGVSHGWHGMFSTITYIQRLDTVGGLAPADPPTEAGQIARVPYTATYVFFEADE